MTPENIAHVRVTWALVVPIADTAASIFYERLFTLDPSLRPLFANSEPAAQRRKLVQALAMAVASLDRLDELVPTLEALGSRHAGYGVHDAHYETVGRALIDTLEQGLGGAWTSETAAAWMEAYGIVADTMRRAQARAVSSMAAA
jgi:hemoglobin-like flavoprotein